MTAPPGEFLESGSLPYDVFSSPAAGDFVYFEDIDSCNMRPMNLRTVSHDPKADYELSDEESEDDSDFVDAQIYESSSESEEAPPGYLCIKLSGTVLGSMKCEDIMGTNITLECSVLLNDEELIAVNIEAPHLSLRLNEHQYGLILGMIYGNFADLLIGMFGQLEILVDPYTDFAKGTVGVRALQSIDIAVRHAESFAAMQDAIA